jgi:hypothetical protein
MSTGVELLGLARDAMTAAGEAEVEVSVKSAKRGFARFAMGDLGQHMELSEPQVLVRVAGGPGRNRIAQTATNRLDVASIATAIREAAKAAVAVPETAGFAGFTSGDEPVGASPPRFERATAEMSAEGRADKVAPVLDAISRAGLVAAGALEMRATSVALATTRGRRVSHDGTTANF